MLASSSRAGSTIATRSIEWKGDRGGMRDSYPIPPHFPRKPRKIDA